MLRTLSILLLVIGAVNAQITYKAEADVTVAWEATTGPVEEGNGMFASPKYNVIVALSSDCSLTGFEPTTGEVLLEYKATGTCYGGVFFTDNYMAFTVSDATADSR
jgi:hypothetical protein